jgi:Flp pilus assembly protein TadG
MRPIRRGQSNKRAAADRGTAAVEFAVVAPVFVLMLFGTFEFGRALWTRASLQYAVQQAARCASVAALRCDNSTDTAGYAASSVLGITVPVADFTVSAPTCGNKVAASVPFTFIVPRLFSYSITLTASSCYPK